MPETGCTETELELCESAAALQRETCIPSFVDIEQSRIDNFELHEKCYKAMCFPLLCARREDVIKIVMSAVGVALRKRLPHGSQFYLQSSTLNSEARCMGRWLLEKRQSISLRQAQELR